MSYHYEILPDERCILQRFTGEVSLGDVLDALKSLFADRLFDRSYCGITDLRGIDLHVQPHEVDTLIDFVAESGVGTARWALVVDDPKSTALGFLYKRKRGHAIHICGDWRSACSYIGVALKPR